MVNIFVTIFDDIRKIHYWALYRLFEPSRKNLITFRNQNVILNNIHTYLSAYWFLLLKDRMRITGIHPQHSLIKSIDVFPITCIYMFQTLYRQHHFMSISNHIYWLLFKFMDSEFIYRYLYIPIPLIEMWRDWFWIGIWNLMVESVENFIGHSIYIFIIRVVVRLKFWVLWYF